MLQNGCHSRNCCSYSSSYMQLTALSLNRYLFLIPVVIPRVYHILLNLLLLYICLPVHLVQSLLLLLLLNNLFNILLRTLLLPFSFSLLLLFSLFSLSLLLLVFVGRVQFGFELDHLFLEWLSLHLLLSESFVLLLIFQHLFLNLQFL